MFALMVLVLSMGPPLSELPEGLTVPEWEDFAQEMLYSEFSYDPEIKNNIILIIWDTKGIRCEIQEINDNKYVIIMSTGFIKLLEHREELVSFMAHEIGHVKTEPLLMDCGKCGERCGEKLADVFTADFLDFKGYSVCGAKNLLLKLLLRGYEIDEERIRFFRQYCPRRAAP